MRYLRFFPWINAYRWTSSLAIQRKIAIQRACHTLYSPGSTEGSISPYLHSQRVTFFLAFCRPERQKFHSLNLHCLITSNAFFGGGVWLLTIWYSPFLSCLFMSIAQLSLGMLSSISLGIRKYSLYISDGHSLLHLFLIKPNSDLLCAFCLESYLQKLFLLS